MHLYQLFKMLLLCINIFEESNDCLNMCPLKSLYFPHPPRQGLSVWFWSLSWTSLYLFNTALKSFGFQYLNLTIRSQS